MGGLAGGEARRVARRGRRLQLAVPDASASEDQRPSILEEHAGAAEGVVVQRVRPRVPRHRVHLVGGNKPVVAGDGGHLLPRRGPPPQQRPAATRLPGSAALVDDGEVRVRVQLIGHL